MPRLSTAEACLPPLPDDAVFQLLVQGAPKVGHLCPETEILTFYLVILLGGTPVQQRKRCLSW